MTQEELEIAIKRLIEDANRLTYACNLAYEKEVARQTGRALARRTARSTIFERTLTDLAEENKRALAKIQEELDESLAALRPDNESGGGSGSTDAPYEVDYSLPIRERYVIVKNYYLSYTDPAAAYEDCLKDQVAAEYLGEYKEYLLQLLRMQQRY